MLYKRIGINGDFLVADLKRLGCGPRKSFTLQFPDSSQVPDNLIRHFMRGFFDGDGSIKYVFQEKPKHVLWKFNLIGPKEFLIRYQDVLIQHCGFNRTKLYEEKRTSQPMFYLDVGSTNRKNLIKLFDFLYNDATVFLQRKYDKFLEIDSLILKKIEWRKLNPIGIPEGRLEEFKKIMTENCDKPLQYVCNLLGRKDAQTLKNLYVRLGIPRN